MTARISAIPAPARRFQGVPAGLVTRVAAHALDLVVVGVLVVGGYAAVVALRLVLTPRTFRPPETDPWWLLNAFLIGQVAYLTVGWWVSGRTFGGRVMGVRVRRSNGAPLGLARALARAAACVLFPLGLLWCVVSPGRRSVQDVVLRTRVVYDWRSADPHGAPRPARHGESS